MIVLCVAVAGCVAQLGSTDRPAGRTDPVPWDAVEDLFRGRHATFVLLDYGAQTWDHYNLSRARERYVPASTFKIPHTIIALESRVVGGQESLLVWDSIAAPRELWWPASWARDHTLASAFRNSAVWYYQEIARRVGEEAMTAYLDGFGYGNRAIDEGIDQFWLSGPLRISAEEQVEFLARFYHDELGIAPGSTSAVKDLLIMKETPEYRLSGKTGWAGFGDPSAPQVGWFAGYLERNGSTYFFALNLEISNAADARARVQLVEDALGRLGLMDPPGGGP